MAFVLHLDIWQWRKEIMGFAIIDLWISLYDRSAMPPVLFTLHEWNTRFPVDFWFNLLHVLHLHMFCIAIYAIWWSTWFPNCKICLGKRYRTVFIIFKPDYLLAQSATTQRDLNLLISMWIAFGTLKISPLIRLRLNSIVNLVKEGFLSISVEWWFNGFTPPNGA